MCGRRCWGAPSRAHRDLGAVTETIIGTLHRDTTNKMAGFKTNTVVGGGAGAVGAGSRQRRWGRGPPIMAALAGCAPARLTCQQTTQTLCYECANAPAWAQPCATTADHISNPCCIVSKWHLPKQPPSSPHSRTASISRCQSTAMVVGVFTSSPSVRRAAQSWGSKGG